MKTKIISILLLAIASAGIAQHNPHFVGNRSVIVHLMDWKFSDVAAECERFLGPRGYGGVQLSPIAEHQIVAGRPWWERYQPISYKIVSRSGDEGDFLDMTRRCNAVGVRIYIDTILNHMSAAAPGGETIGIGGSLANPGERQFPAVPFGPWDFNEPKCEISDWNNLIEVRQCNLVGLEDLYMGKEWVREKQLEHLNHMIELGVAGFRVDAGKHMWPHDVEYLFNNVNSLNTNFGFAPNSRSFVYQEVIDYGGEAITRQEYEHIGAVTDFKFSQDLGRLFRRNDYLKWLHNFGTEWGLLASSNSFCFVDNHDNQRDHGEQLTYKDPRPYKMATAFALAHPHGHRRIMSSFDFFERDQGPPMDANGNIISPVINPDNTCAAGWVCEHRWRQIYNMVDFRNVVQGTAVTDWWDNGFHQIAFGRGDKGFIAFNNEETVDLDIILKSSLPAGRYCDVISGNVSGNSCSGREVIVAEGGYLRITLPAAADDGVVAIHVGPNSKLA